MEYRVLVTPAFFGRKDSAPVDLLNEAGCEVVPSPYRRTQSGARRDVQCIADLHDLLLIVIT